MRFAPAVLSLIAIMAIVPLGYAAEEVTFRVVVDRGADLGHNFGSSVRRRSRMDRSSLPTTTTTNANPFLTQLAT